MNQQRPKTINSLRKTSKILKTETFTKSKFLASNNPNLNKMNENPKIDSMRIQTQKSQKRKQDVIPGISKNTSKKIPKNSYNVGFNYTDDIEAVAHLTDWFNLNREKKNIP